MERRLHAAAREGTPALIVRAGDYFGPTARNSWFSQAMVTPGKPVGTIWYPGRTGIGHQWAYLPDVAETMVRLLAMSDSLEPYAVFHMEGHWDEDGTQMVAAIRKAAVRRRIRVAPMPWPAIRLLWPVAPFFRELLEMQYLWRTPVRMNNHRLLAALGTEPHTPLDVAVRETLNGLGCLTPRRVTGEVRARRKSEIGMHPSVPKIR
jgi:nucleoside-diphosphate-sugar epimerase